MLKALDVLALAAALALTALRTLARGNAAGATLCSLRAHRGYRVRV